MPAIFWVNVWGVSAAGATAADATAGRRQHKASREQAVRSMEDLRGCVGKINKSCLLYSCIQE
jgi:hypothetical protein